jgi:organic radical activating enzyme
MADFQDLPVVETFHSLQGEGHHAGRSAFFIRLAGCSVGCPWCDTKHSWPVDQHPAIAVETLAQQALNAQNSGAAFVVVTGGEPLHQDLAPLTQALDRHVALPIHLETSGVDPLSGRFDWITLSPKRHQPPRHDLLKACHELKVVVHGPEDIRFAAAMEKECHDNTLRLLQPGWQSATGEQLALQHVRQHAKWRLSLQSHKWLGIR